VNFVDKAVTLAEKLKRLTTVLEGAVEDNTNGDFFLNAAKILEELSKNTINKKFVRDYLDLVLSQNFSSVSEKSKSSAGKFLVETVRLCNVTLHDTAYLIKLRDLCAKANIPWKGQVDECIKTAHFAGLDYLDHEGGYIYCAV
jgi:hypothetical protein